MAGRLPAPLAGRLPGAPSKGFTLLEVMIAIMIFSVCITAIYTSFRTSAQSFENGKRSAEQMQTVRFTVDQITRDLRSIFYETDYNSKFDQMERDANSRQEELLQQIEEEREKQSKPSRRDDEEENEEDDYLGTKVNLQFHGEDNADSDSIEFAHFLPSDGTSDNSFLGGERIRYYLKDQKLYRQRSRVLQMMQLNPNLIEDLERAHDAFAQETSKEKDEKKRKTVEELYGGSSLLSFLSTKLKVKYYVPVQEEESPPELIATNVKKLLITYGYYFFDEWQETDSWDSESKEHRTPAFNIEPTDPEFMNKMLAYETRPQDHLPSYVRIRLSVGDQNPDRKVKKDETNTVESSSKRAYSTDTVVWLPSAQEVYVPTDEDYFEPPETGELPDSGMSAAIRRSEKKGKSSSQYKHHESGATR